MRLLKPYLTILLVGLALGRNIGTEKANENNEAPLLSGAKTLKNNPKTYYGNQMRMKFLNGERTSNTDNIRKPIEAAIKEDEVIPSADVSKLEVVKQPKIESKLIKTEDAAKVKETELKEAISDQEIKQHQSGKDKTNAILDAKKSLTVPNSKNNFEAAAAEPKINQIVKKIKGVPAISNPKEPTKSKENSNLDAVPLGLQGAVFKGGVKEDSANEKSNSKEKIAKGKVGMESESESSKTSETKNKADKYSDKENNDEVKEKEAKSSHSSSEVKGDLKMINAEIENNLSKVSKADDSHKNKDKYYEKKRKVDDDDDDNDSDDEDSSDEDGD